MFSLCVSNDEGFSKDFPCYSVATDQRCQRCWCVCYFIGCLLNMTFSVLFIFISSKILHNWESLKILFKTGKLDECSFIMEKLMLSSDFYNIFYDLIIKLNYNGDSLPYLVPLSPFKLIQCYYSSGKLEAVTWNPIKNIT